jgi:magnesium-transporting ATPase (P-type)
MTAPSYRAVHSIVTFFRILQSVGPAFLASCELLWPRDDVSFQSISVLSVFCHIIPPSARAGAQLYVLIVCLVFQLAVLIIWIASARCYQKNASLPPALVSFIAFYCASLALVLFPITLELCIETFRRCFSTLRLTLRSFQSSLLC